MRGVRREHLLAAIALLDEALIIVGVVAAALWLSSRLGLPVTPLEAVIAVSPLAVFTAIACVKAVDAISRPPSVGSESMEGKKGVIRGIIGGRVPRLIVEVEGELWHAECRGCAPRVGEKVVVVGVRGLTLIVEPAESKREVVEG